MTSNTLFNDYLKPIGVGWGISLGLTPIAFSSNYLSVLVATGRASMYRQALSLAYESPGSGFKFHLLKEMARVAIKVPLVRIARPWINEQAQQYNMPKTGDIAYATLYASVTETSTNFLEKAKVHEQMRSGTNGNFTGTIAGIVRLVPGYSLWTYSCRQIDNYLEDQGQNPHDFKFLPIRATVITHVSLAPTYCISRLRLEMHTGYAAKALGTPAPVNYSYLEAFKNIINSSQGLRGLYAGYLAKSVCVLSATTCTLFCIGYDKQSTPLTFFDHITSVQFPKNETEQMLMFSG